MLPTKLLINLTLLANVIAASWVQTLQDVKSQDTLFNKAIEYVYEQEIEKTGYIYLGDSRTVGMNIACHIDDEEDTYVVAKVGEGYRWMTKTALPEINEIVTKNPDITDWVIVTNLGVNDLGSLNNYVSSYEQLSSDFMIYFVSVNPTSKSYSSMNSTIDAFNTEMSEQESVVFIDSNSFLKDSGFEAPDGLHYSTSTYEKLYAFVKESITKG